MSPCCGEKRNRWSRLTGERTVERPRDLSQPALFEYTGGTALTVTGPYSGTTYRFEAPGSQVQIDGRDAGALSGIPVLILVPPL